MIKNIIISLCAVLGFFNNTYSQNNPFVGTWQWENGSQIFRVNLRIENEKIRGGFCMLEVNSAGIVINTIYKSDKDIPSTYGINYDVIFANSDGYELGGSIQDNSSSNSSNWLDGVLEMVIQNNSSGVVTATWKVKRGQGIRASTDNRTFNIPTDIILTKVYNL